MDQEAAAGEPIYLELVDALQLCAAIVGCTSTQAADQLRDQGALEGALGRPRSYAHYEDADLMGIRSSALCKRYQSACIRPAIALYFEQTFPKFFQTAGPTGPRLEADTWLWT